MAARSINRMRPVQRDGGVTQEQAMELSRRFHEAAHAAPTIAYDMGLPYEVVCAVLDGQHWPAVRALWMDRVFPGPRNPQCLND